MARRWWRLDLAAWFKHKPASSNRLGFETPEPRILLSADIIGGAFDGNDLQKDDQEDLHDQTNVNNLLQQVTATPTETKTPSLGSPQAFNLNGLNGLLHGDDQDGQYSDDIASYLAGLPAEESRVELIFVDNTVTDYQAFVDDIDGRSDGTAYKVFILDGESSGIDQMTDILQDYEGVDAVHIVSHGTDGNVRLGDTWLNENNLNEHEVLLTAWRSALDPDADLLIYGCNLAINAQGESLMQGLAALTGMDVAASDDLTGAQQYGADWDLEVKLGDVDTAVPFTIALQENWSHVLAPPTVATPIDDVTVIQGAEDTVIDLLSVFTDVEDTDSDLVYTVTGNTNPALFTATNIDLAADTLTLSFDADEYGTSDITITATDSNSDTTTDTFTVTVNQAGIWISTLGTASTTSLSWQNEDVVSLSGASFALGTSTAGTFSQVFDAEDFISPASDVNVDAIHHVTTDLTIGTANTVDVKTGDLLLSLDKGATLTGTSTSLAVSKNDVFIFRPDAPGDYSAGEFYRLLVSGSTIAGITLVEEDVIVGETLISAGSFLFVESQNVVNLFTPGDLGTGTGVSTGTTSILINGAEARDSSGDKMIFEKIIGLELIENDMTVGGVTLTSGNILMTVETTDTVLGEDGTNPDTTLVVQPADVFVADVTKTSLGTDPLEATATMLFEGADVELTTVGETAGAVTLFAPVAGLPNTDPAAVADAYGVNEGETLTVLAAAGVLDNDSDADLDAITALLVSGPSHATSFNLNADGSFTYTHDGHETTSDSFVYVVSDGKGGIARETVTISIRPAVDPAKLWLSTAENVLTAGVTNTDSWNDQIVVGFSGPGLKFDAGTTTSTVGFFSTDFDIENFIPAATDVNVNALHHVMTDMTIGTSNTVDVKVGDLLISLDSTASLMGTDAGTLNVDSDDVFIFRPDVIGDYSQGSFIALLTDVNGDDANITAITLVESDTVLTGSRTLNQGEFLFVADGKEINLLEPGDLGSTTIGTVTLLVDGDEGLIPQKITGIELIEEDVTIGDSNLSGGDILLTLEADETVMGSLAVEKHDIFIADFTATTADDTTSAGTATLFFDGSDINFADNDGNPDAISLQSPQQNIEPTLSITGSNPTFNAGGGAVGLFSGASVSTVEAAQTIKGLTLTVSNVTDTGQEQLTIDGTTITLDDLETGSTTNFTYNVSVAGSTATVVLSAGTASEATVAAALNGATYQNNSGTPTDADRLVTITQLIDSGGVAYGGDDTNDLAGLTSTVDVEPANNEPTLTITGSNPIFNAGVGAVGLFSGANVSTVEVGQTITGLTLTVSNVTDAGNEQLTIDSTTITLDHGQTGATANFTYNVTVVANTATVVLSAGTASEATVEAALNGATYQNNSANPTNADRVVEVTQLVDSGAATDNTNDLTGLTSTVINQAGIWISTSGNGATTSLSWQDDDLVSLGGATFSLGTTTAGTFSLVQDTEGVFANVIDVDAVHFVTTDLTIGTANTVDVKVGDVLFSTVSFDNLTGTTTSLYVEADDVFIFRPDTPGDYSAGEVYRLLDGGPSDVNAITLIEEDVIVGDTLLRAGTFLYSSGNQIFHHTPGDLGVAADSGTGTTVTLIDGDDLRQSSGDPMITEGINGIDIVENEIILGGQTLKSGSLLVSVEFDDTVMGEDGTMTDTTLAVEDSDIFLVDVTRNSLGADPLQGTATMLFEGADVELTMPAEEVDAVSLNSVIGTPNSDPNAVADSYNVVAGVPLTVNAAAGLINNDSDPDLDGLSVVLVSGPDHAASFSLSADGSFTYDHDGGATLTDTFTYAVSDGLGGIDTSTATLTVDVNDEPTLTITGSDPTFNEGGGTVGLFTGASVSTVEVGQTITGLTLTISNVTDTGNEQLTIDGTTITLDDLETGATTNFTYNVTVVANTATVVLSAGTASEATVEAALNGATYQNNSADPTDANRVVEITQLVDSGAATDNTNDLAGLTSTVDVEPVNDEPTLTITGSNPTFNEGGAAAGLFSGASVSTIESGQTITGLTLTISNVTDTGNEQLTIDGTTITLDDLETGATTNFTYNVSVVANTATVVLSAGTASEATVEAALNGATYQNNSADPTDANRVVEITQLVDSGAATDNTNDLAGLTSTVDVEPVNDEPTLTITGSDPTFTEGGAAAGLFSGAAVSTVESGQTITGLTITIGNITPPNAGLEQLTIDGATITLDDLETGSTSNFTYNVSVTGNTATVVLSGGTASAATVEAALNGATYQHNGNEIDAISRTATITQIVDSGGVANGGDNTNDLAGLASTVTLNNVNDEPTLTITGADPTFSEGGAAAGLFSGASVSTIESGQTITGLTLTISNVTDTGNEQLTIDGATITLDHGQTGATANFTYNVTVVANTATVVLSAGTASEATVEAALNGATYQNNSADPTDANRVVEVTQLVDSGDATDNTNDLAGLTSTVDVEPINDEPTITITGSNPTFNEGGAAAGLFSGASVSTIESGQTITGLTLTISNVTDTGNEQLTIDGTTITLDDLETGATTNFTYNVSVVANTATVVLSAGTASEATVEAALNGATYQNNSADPTDANRVVEVTQLVDSGDATDNTNDLGGLTSTVDVEPINDEPTLTITGSNPTFNEGGAAAGLFSGASVSTIESGQTITGLTLTISNVTDTGNEQLTIDGATITLDHGQSGATTNFTYNVSVVANTATVVLSAGTASEATVEAALNGATYQNNSADPTDANRVVEITQLVDSGDATDNTNDLGGLTSAVDVEPVNDEPTLTITGSNPTFNEGGAAAGLFSGASVSTIESGQTITGLTLTISNVTDTGNEQLTIDGTTITLDDLETGATANFTYNVSVVANTATVVLSAGTASEATVEAALNGATYQNNSADPTDANRVVEVTQLVDSGAATDNTNDLAGLTSTVDVEPVNDEPTLTITGSDPTFNEGGAAAGLFSGASVSTIESGQTITGLTLTISNVTDTGNEQLTIDGTTITLDDLETGTTTNFTYNVTVVANTATVVLSAGTASEATVEAALNGATYQNNSADPTDANRVVEVTQLVDSGAATDNTNDLAGLTSTVDVEPVNDEPTLTITGSNPTFTEGGAAAGLFSGASVSTIESGQTITGLTLTISNVTDTGNEQLTIDGTTITLDDLETGATANFTYNVTVAANTATVVLSAGTASEATVEAALNGATYQNNSADPTDANRVVEITQLVDSGAATDNTNDLTGLTSTVDVEPVNDEPTLTITGSDPTFNEGGAAAGLFSGATVSTVESGQTITGLTLTVSNVTDAGNEQLTIDGTTITLDDLETGATANFTYNVTVAANTATVVLSAGTASAATVEAALNGATYQNNSQDPTDADRVVSITQLIDSGAATDNTNDLTGLTSTVDVEPVNDSPVVGGAGGTLAYTEDDAAIVIESALTITDVDDTSIDSATISITGGLVNTEDVLAFTNTGTITGSYNATTGVMTLTGADTLANYEAALNSITYANTNTDDPDTGNRTVTWVVNDGDVNSTGVTSTITVATANDVPVITDAAGTTGYSIGTGAQIIDADLSVADVDGDNLVSAKIVIGAGFNNTEDILSFTPVGAITGIYNPITGVLELTGIDSPANYELALESVTYANTDLLFPSLGPRTITWTVNDGTSDSVGVNSTVTVAASNIPQVKNAGDTLLYSEGDGAQVIDGSLTVTDNSGFINKATVSITGGFVAGEDELAFTNAFGITGSYNAATGVLTLTGATTDNNYSLALESVTYTNTNTDDPNTGSRTVTWVVTDPVLNDSPAVNSVIKVAGVNDEPTLTLTGSDPTFNEGGAAAGLFSGATVSTVEAGQTITGLTITIDNVLQPNTGLEQLSIDGATITLDHLETGSTSNFTYNVSRAANTVTVVLSGGNASAATAEAILNGATYQHNGDEFASPNRTATVTQIVDSGGTAGSGDNTNNLTGLASAITLVEVNDEPTLTITGSDPTFNEGGAAAGLFSGASVSTIESGQTITGLTLTISNVTDTGNEQLTIDGATITLDHGQTGATTNFTYNVTVAANTATVVLSAGTASEASVEAALNGATYQNNAADPTDANRVVEVTQLVDSGAATDNTNDLAGLTSTVDVEPVNDEPTLTITGSNPTFNEGGAAAGLFSGASVSTIESGQTITGLTLTISNVTDTGNEQLNIDGTTITLDHGQTGATANFTYNVTVAANTATVVLSAGTASEAIVEAALNGATYQNNAADPTDADRVVNITQLVDSGAATDNTNDLAGLTSTVDVEPVNDEPTLTITGSDPTFNEGGAAAGLFSGASVSSIESGQTITGLTLTITNVTDTGNEQLTIDGATITLDHGQTGATANFTYNVTVAANTATVVLSAGTASEAIVEAALNGATYQNNAADPTDANRVVEVTQLVDSGAATDNTNDLAGLTSTVDVEPVNDEPTLTITGSNPTFNEGGAAAGLFSGASVSTIESGQTITGLTLTISNVTDTGNEQLNIDGTTITLDHGQTGATGNFTYNVTVAANTATVVLSAGTASEATVEAALNGATYQNNAADPTDANRVVEVTQLVDSGAATDNTNDLAGLTSTVDVEPVNDEPTLTITGSNPTFNEGGGAAGLFSGASVSTMESGQTITGLTLTITNVTDTGNEQLTIDGATITLDHGQTGATTNFTYNVTVAANTATVVLSAGTASEATVEAALNGATYQNNSADPTDADRVVNITQLVDSGAATDNTNDLAGLTSTVDVEPVNDEPTLTITGSDPTFNEGGAAAGLFSGASVSTVEGGQTITGLTLTITNVTDTGNEQLNIDGTTITLDHGQTGATTNFTYNVTVAANTATVVLSAGTASEAIVEAALNGATYQNNAADPTDADRVVNITQLVDSGAATDNTNDLAGLTSTVDVEPVNDEPTLTITGSNPTFNEGGAAAGLFSGASVSTIESGQTITGLTVTISNVTDTGNEQLNIDGTTITLDHGQTGATTNFTYNVTVAANTATVVLSAGTASEASVEAALNGATYQNLSEDPTDANRVVAVTQLVDSGAATDNTNNFAGLTSTVDVNPTNDAPTTSSNNLSTPEDVSYTFTATDFNFADVDGGDVLTSVKITGLESVGSLELNGVDVTLNQVITRSDIDAGKLKFVPVANATGIGYDSFNFSVNDGTTDSTSSATITMDVNPANNDAPTASNQTVITPEDNDYTFDAGDFNFSDVDGDPLVGVRITSLAGVGTLQLNGANVVVNQLISKVDIDADKLKFVPVANANGAGYDSFDFKVNDGLVDSVAASTVTIDVTAVNDPPTVANSTKITSEDSTITFAATDFAVSDLDSGASLATIKITSLESAGALQLSGTDVTLNQVITKADIDAGKLKFIPAANANGAAYDNFSFTANDGSLDSTTSATLTIDVTAVDDPPTTLNGTVVTLEDTTRTLTAADFAYADIEGAALASIKITSLESAGALQLNSVDVTLNQIITKADIDAGKLKFIPAANANGIAYDSFDFTVNDGTLDSVAAATLTVDVTPVNDAPTALDNTVTGTEDNTFTFKSTDFPATDADGDPVVSITVTELEAVGALEYNGAAVTVNQVITVADLDAGKLKFVPVADAYGPGYDTFKFTVSDGIDNSNEATLTLDVTAVNDAPTTVDNTVLMAENTTRIFTAADFNFLDVDPDNLFSIQITSLESAGTLQLGGVDVILNQVVTRADIDAGQLRFTPQANANGAAYDSFTFTVNDGALDSTASATLTLDVVAVNNAPTGGNTTVGTPEDTTYTYSAGDFTFADVDVGDTLSSIEVTALETVGSLQLNSVDVTVNQVISKADIDAGKLKFIPAPNGNGLAYDSFQYTVSDGLADSVAASTQTINVSAVNDAPTTTDNTLVTTENTPYIFSAGDFNFADIDSGAALASIEVTSLEAVGFLRLNGVDVTLNQVISKADIDAGLLRFTPLTNENGMAYDSFDFTVNDGGLDSVSAATITINVTATNSAPTTSDNTVSTTEDTAYTFSATDFNYLDPEGAALASVRITSLETAGALQLSGTDVSLNQVITRADIDAGNLKFVPVANAYGGGYDSFDFTVNDGVLDSASATLTLDVAAVDDAPTTIDNAVITAENTPYIFSAGDFNFADDDPGAALASIEVTSLEAVGSLRLNGVDVTLNQVISKADIDAGLLRFTPLINENGAAYDSFDFTVNDGGLDSVAAATITINVSSVNSAPTTTDNTVAMAEDTAYTFSATDFNYADVEGAALASVRITGLETVGALQLSGIDVSLNQVITRADIDAGKLKFVPVADATGIGYDSFRFSVNDGVLDSAASATLTMDVTPANDAPTATNLDSSATYLEDAVSVALDDIVVSDIDPAQTITAILTLTDPATGVLTTSGGATYDALTGVWTATGSPASVNSALSSIAFEPTLDGELDTTITTHIEDQNGAGPADGTITLSVTPENDAPVAGDNTVATLEDTAYTFVAGDFNFADVDASATLASVEISNLTSAGALQLAGIDVTLNQVISKADIDAGNLKFVPDADASGTAYDSFSFTVNDGALDSILPATMTIDVTATVDAPTTTDNTVITSEDTTYVFSTGDFNFSDSDTGDSLVSVKIGGLVSSGSLQLGGVDVTLNQVVSRADIDAGLLAFVPIPNENGAGYDNFAFTVNDGTFDSTSSATMTVDVTAVNDPDTGAVTIQGIAREDEVLTADTTTLADEDGLGTFTYQWQRNGVNIPGANGSTYTLSDVDVDSTISVSVRFFDGDGTLESSQSPATGPIVNVNDLPTGAVLILGEPTVGEQLTLNTTTIADDDGLGAFSYQWLRDGVDVDGETADTYALTVTDATAKLTVRVTYTDNHGTFETVTSVPSPGISRLIDLEPTEVNLLEDNQPLEVALDTLFEDTENLDFEISSNTNTELFEEVTVDNGVLTVPLKANASGDAVITVAATDADGVTTVESVTINVAPVNDAPLGEPDTAVIDEDSVLTITVEASILGNDSDVDEGDSLRVVEVSNGINVVAAGNAIAGDNGGEFQVASDGAYTFDPRDDFQSLSEGEVVETEVMYILADDQGDTMAVPLRITIVGTNDALTANEDFGSTGSDQSVSVIADDGVLANDSDIDTSDVLSVVSISNGVETVAAGETIRGNSGGSFTVQTDGSYTFQPGAEFSELTEGTQRLTSVDYTVSDGAGNTETVSLSMTVAGRAPIATAAQATTNETQVNDEPVVVEAAVEAVIEPVQENIEEVAVETAAEEPEEENSEAEADPEATASIEDDEFFDGETPDGIIQTGGDNLTFGVDQLASVVSIGSGVNVSPIEGLSVTSIEGIVDRASIGMLGLSDALVLISSPDYRRSLDEARQITDQEQQQADDVMGGTLTVTAGISIGYVFWLIRSGVIMSSVLSAIPAWRLVDPLPILSSLTGSDEEEGESLEELVQSSNDDSETTDAHNDDDKALESGEQDA